ncbi:universal stress protein [Thalassotalea marina]|uniref:Universal stress protein n=1 Tax=Thalassotalea marina TaxID=1673741 RepID=A0A919BHE3_9GAMM|nr:universal stress protein [Thalassotalea marina]GHF91498.1 universal stress protein [Thalassotalea marina]
MESLTVKNAIWLVDCKHETNKLVLQKVVRFVKTYQSDLTIVFDQRLRAIEKKYWFNFAESEALEKEWHNSVEKSKNNIVKLLAKSNIDYQTKCLDKGNYRELFKILNEDSLLILQDETTEQRHPIFQQLASIPCHVYIAKKDKWNEQPKVMGAIDPLHENARPFDLDHLIVNHVRALAKHLEAQWYLGHASYVQAAFLKYKKEFDKVHHDGVNAFVDSIGVNRRRVVFLNGLPEDAINKWVKTNEVDITVMGIVARNNWISHLVGSTTVALLQNPPSDMLLIKSMAEDE